MDVFHKRFTDDPVHDPCGHTLSISNLSSEANFVITHSRYAATRGLFFSHMGWIFYKPNYERMSLIDKDDLENDPGGSLVCSL